MHKKDTFFVDRYNINDNENIFFTYATNTRYIFITDKHKNIRYIFIIAA